MRRKRSMGVSEWLRGVVRGRGGGWMAMGQDIHHSGTSPDDGGALQHEKEKKKQQKQSQKQRKKLGDQAPQTRTCE
ncbi:hypothetical protein CCHR01_08107 [Colletotrichum chrysophilum]|uniref:Uncharacterized protein n=1 Tax=Colletotrichum chrysophilum TaxID=1836956 RepID=A0AAD9EI60_9PEZI|nr:hypothetical protein CCHR01_08107 [Colletotrichum chrysophilum]